MKRHQARTTALATALAFVLLAPMATADSTQYRYPPGHYLVDFHATTVHFRVKSLFGAYEGNFIEPTGSVAISPDRPEKADIDISFPVSRLTTGDASTDQMLKGSSFFDMEHFPTVRFVADGTPIQGGDTLQVEGALTMHGQTRPVVVTAHMTTADPAQNVAETGLHFTGEASVKRSLFGMGFGRPFVADKVDLTIDATFHHGETTPAQEALDAKG
jgi:polyisoprenoid-binding protein YceI